MGTVSWEGTTLVVSQYLADQFGVAAEVLSVLRAAAHALRNLDSSNNTLAALLALRTVHQSYFLPLRLAAPLASA